eukprot:29470-Eustigmatos_ZCMA.PRE.1
MGLQARVERARTALGRQAGDEVLHPALTRTPPHAVLSMYPLPEDFPTDKTRPAMFATRLAAAVGPYTQEQLEK